MGTSPASLTGAIARADNQLTVLDDRFDAEDNAAWLWLRAHQLHGHPHHVVIGTEPLPAAWHARTAKHWDKQYTASELRPFVKDHAAMHSLRAIARTLSTGGTHALTDEEVITTVARALVNGNAWAIQFPSKRPKSRFIGKTDPAAFAPINPSRGTNVDFAFIASLEGDQWLRGYVPMRKSVVVGRSGMTVASGFDVGQWHLKNLQQDMKLPSTLVTKLKPFLSPHNFKSKTKAQVAEEVGQLGPVPVLSKAEADLCDAAVFGNKLDTAITLWDRGRHRGVPSFTALPSGWQTVWLSRVYQGKTASFGHLALAGSWQPAIAALRADTEYPERTNREADLLETELPPPNIVPKAGLSK